MNKILLFLLAVTFSLNTLYSQKNLNDYKYVSVPNQYDFLQETDKYQLNSLTKFLFNKYGFTALMVDEALPQDVQSNNCLALKSNVVKHNSLMKTKLQVELRDCTNALVFKTDIGETREKDFSKAYNLALREAFKSFNAVNYKYSGKTTETKAKDDADAIKEIEKEDNSEVEKLKAKIKKLESEKEIVKEIPEKIEIVEVEKPMVNKVEVKVIPEPAHKVQPNENILYAQQTENGFQVVDSTPKVVMILYNSGRQDTFIVIGKDAIVYKEDGFWYLSESLNGKTETKQISIKF